METTYDTIVALLRPSGDGIEGLFRSSSFLTYGVGLFILALIFRRNGNKAKCLDMDGVPMKELSVSPKAAVLFKPQISKQGERLAHDEPYIIRDGNYREVVLHTPEHVREFLRNDSKGMANFLNIPYGEQWRVIRSYFDPAYTHNTGLAMLPAFQNEVAGWLNTLKNDSLRAGYLQTIDEMLFTNIEVTGSILTFMLTQLAKHQDFQQRLYEEIMAQKTEEGFEVRNYVTRQTTLLHYLTLESVRLRPATWFSAPECITIDKVIGRYKLPAKTPVVIDVRRLNTNALTWGPDGTEFRPERFASLSPNEYRYGYMRFGVVSGKCLGKHMADLLMKVAMITILEQYRIEEVEMNIGVKDGDLAFIKRK
ncbi:hypothetical protein DL762_003609 [Monosporascus cannonballus]|uniref:Cytochrome P450 n=1 Tax=Monosporascus cannonballus TaxID=155416 RepID=A0ABY0HCX5_9PEZI|nr:hypothetical protein DL762_003609 [Monosporascus cannonballus]